MYDLAFNFVSSSCQKSQLRLPNADPSQSNPLRYKGELQPCPIHLSAAIAANSHGGGGHPKGERKKRPLTHFGFPPFLLLFPEIASFSFFFGSNFPFLDRAVNNCLISTMKEKGLYLSAWTKLLGNWRSNVHFLGITFDASEIKIQQ